MSATPVLEVQLPRDRAAPRQARRVLDQRFSSALTDTELETAQLLASELVNNAVLHGKGLITLRAILDEDRLLVEVIDEGSGFEHTVRERDLDGIGGWGLGIVEAASSRWGIHEGTTHVWFELERSGPRIGVRGKPSTPDS